MEPQSLSMLQGLPRWLKKQQPEVQWWLLPQSLSMLQGLPTVLDQHLPLVQCCSELWQSESMEQVFHGEEFEQLLPLLPPVPPVPPLPPAPPAPPQPVPSLLGSREHPDGSGAVVKSAGTQRATAAADGQV